MSEHCWKYHRLRNMPGSSAKTCLSLRESLAYAEQFEMAVENRGLRAKRAAIRRGEIPADV